MRKLQDTRRDIMPNGCGGIQNVQLKYLVIGDFGVGKTAIVRRYVDGRFTSNYKVTIGADFTLKSMLWDERTRIHLQLWDIAGHERFGCMTRVYYKNAVAAVVVVDITRSNTIQTVNRWLQDLREKVTLNDGSALPVILLANKCDVPNCTVPSDLIQRLCKDYHIDAWFPTSAKDNINIDEAFNFLTKDSIQRWKMEQIYANNNLKEGIVLNKRPIFDKKCYESSHSCC